ncbi:hypothetical protein EJB05_29509, partial [Eragrostis curvula]
MWNAEGRIQRSSDIAISTPKGKSYSFDACFTSPLARSHRTTEAIWEGRGDDLLREGEIWGSAQAAAENAANFSIDGHCHVQNCWERILAHEGKSVLVVAHDAVNQDSGTCCQFELVLNTLGFCSRAIVTGGGTSNVCLNRLNQNPTTPVAADSSAGRKTNKRIILACQRATQKYSPELCLGGTGYALLNMLGTIQKTAELRLDLNVNGILCSRQVAAVDTSTVQCNVQEAAGCLGADCMPRYVEMKKLLELEFDDAFQMKPKLWGYSSVWLAGQHGIHKTGVAMGLVKDAWQALLNEMSDDGTSNRVPVAVGHPAIHLAFICHCL